LAGIQQGRSEPHADCWIVADSSLGRHFDELACESGWWWWPIPEVEKAVEAEDYEDKAMVTRAIREAIFIPCSLDQMVLRFRL
jgi:hypothetical protein